MFEEPEVLASFDRSYGDSREQLRLEKGLYKDKPTFTLRLYWQGSDGTWRWTAQKPTQSGKCWERLNLKAHELRELGGALLIAADQANVVPARQAPYAPPVSASADSLDDIPF